VAQPARGVRTLRVLCFPADFGPQANPYLGIIAEGLSAHGVELVPYRPFRPFQRADVLHLHWLERLWQMRVARPHPALSFLAFAILHLNIGWTKAFGGRVVWTVHNLRPHDGVEARHAWVWSFWFGKIWRRVDAVICMSEGAVAAVREAFPEIAGAKVYVAPHPHYRTIYAGSGRDIRVELKIPHEATVLAMVGQIRPYKGILEVARLFAQLEGADLRLLIAGWCQDEAYLRHINEIAALDYRIIVVAGRLSHAEFAALVRASDVCLFNFADILNSGSVIAALSLDRRVMAPAKGAVPELAAMVGPDWLRMVETMDGPALERAVAWAREKRPDGAPDLSALDPAQVAAAHLAAYRGEEAYKRG